MEHGLTYAFKENQFLSGENNFSADTFMIALYEDSEDLNLADITAYTTTNETTAIGYVAGGKELSLASGYPKMNTDSAPHVPVGSTIMFDFDDVTWDTVVGTVRGAMIYNSSNSNAAIALIDFGGDIAVDGDLTITWPNPDILGAMIRVM